MKSSYNFHERVLLVSITLLLTVTKHIKKFHKIILNEHEMGLIRIVGALERNVLDISSMNICVSEN